MDGAEKEMAGKTETWILVVALLGLGCSDADPKAACERWVESVNECTKEYILAIGAEWNDEERLRASARRDGSRARLGGARVAKSSTCETRTNESRNDI